MSDGSAALHRARVLNSVSTGRGVRLAVKVGADDPAVGLRWTGHDGRFIDLDGIRLGWDLLQPCKI